MPKGTFLFSVLKKASGILLLLLIIYSSPNFVKYEKNWFVKNSYNSGVDGAHTVQWENHTVGLVFSKLFSGSS